MKLSKVQQKVLNKMEQCRWYSAYDLHCSLATLDALKKRGYLINKGHGALGSFAFPRIGIKWKKIKELGK